jgi:hypothetical protein
LSKNKILSIFLKINIEMEEEKNKPIVPSVQTKDKKKFEKPKLICNYQSCECHCHGGTIYFPKEYFNPTFDLEDKKQN